MEPSKEQFYLRRIAELEKQVAELLAQVARRILHDNGIEFWRIES